MGLQRYWDKRDFKLTREPRGKVAKPVAHAGEANTLAFYIQRHDARRLHYDFRLELDGTLKSWAVPKGPSLDPADKRLAVEVEDHPLEYGQFEGDIPQGQYGAGHVMLWDEGTWEAIGDPMQGYRQGALKFYLHGQKLHGKWALVRMKTRDEDKQPNWLLIKEQDEQALKGQAAQITETAPESVKAASKQTARPGIAKNQGAKATATLAATRGAKPKAPKAAGLSDPVTDVASLAPRSSNMPTRLEPQLATLVTQAPEGDEWLSEIKYDGYRALTRLEHGKVTMLSRNGLDWSAKWPALASALKHLPVKQAWLDGEVVAFDEDGNISFQALQNAMRLGNDVQLGYFIFDLLYLDGHDLQPVALQQRKALLQVLLSSLPQTDGQSGPLFFSDHLQGHAPEVFKHACMHGMEGIVVKHAHSPYLQKRSQDWLKVKCGKRQEFVIGGYTEPSGSREAFGALLLGTYNEAGQLQYAGRVGTGFNQDSLKQIAAYFEQLETKKPAFSEPPTGVEAKGVHWLKPTLTAEVKFANWTTSGMVRHASFVGLRSDKPPRSISRETPLDTDQLSLNTAGSAVAASSRPSQVEGIKLSHPEKILFPAGAYTKLDLARHYEALADHILPYLINRPLSIVRCPEGYHHHCFFQKHVTHAKLEHIKVVQLKSGMEAGKTPEYFVANNVQAIIELVQLGVLELHGWGARYPKTALADRMIFDLDPAPEVPWDEVTETALLLRGLFDELDLQSFVKTTGGKGLHVEVPIRPEHEWPVIKSFSQGIARHLENLAPERFTANMSKQRRKGRIFIDYLRNGEGATAVLPYSTRAKPGAPVATPLAWDEVGSQIQADSFNIANIQHRMRNLKIDPWQEYLSSKQRLSKHALKLF